MYKILVIILGLLNNVPSTVTLNSNLVYDNITTCTQALGTEPVIKDIQKFTKTLNELGYKDLEIQEYKCDPIGENA